MLLVRWDANSSLLLVGTPREVGAKMCIQISARRERCASAESLSNTSRNDVAIWKTLSFVARIVLYGDKRQSVAKLPGDSGTKFSHAIFTFVPLPNVLGATLYVLPELLLKSMVSPIVAMLSQCADATLV